MGDRLARGVVDDLRVDVLRAPEDAHARLLEGPADLPADAQFPTLSPNDLHRHRRLLSCPGLGRLARLLANLLALVPHTLATVRLRGAKRANLGSRLPHLFLVRPGENQNRSLRVTGDLAFYALRQRECDGV